MTRLTAVTAANADFKGMMDVCRISTQFRGCPHIIYDVGGLGYGEEFPLPDDSEKAIRLAKPQYMLKARESSDAEIVFWIDADSVVHDFFYEDMNEDFDIGLVVLSHKLKLCASPVFIRNNSRAYHFMRGYIHESRHGRGDMYALRRYVNQHTEITQAHLDWCNPVWVGATRVKLFDSKHYCYKVRTEDDLENIPEGVKIVHFSGQGKTREQKRPQKLPLMEEYVRRYLC